MRPFIGPLGSLIGILVDKPNLKKNVARIHCGRRKNLANHMTVTNRRACRIKFITETFLRIFRQILGIGNQKS